MPYKDPDKAREQVRLAMRKRRDRHEVRVAEREYARQRDPARKLQQRYGLSLDSFDTLLLSQQGRCDICTDPLKDLVVDHDHETGSVRALLCRRCNSGLGYFKDNPAIVLSAHHYLKAHHENR